MHPWDLNEEEARMLQEELAEDCQLEGEPEIDLIAGLDVSFYPESRICIASAVNYYVPDGRIHEKVVLISELNFPYISGLLAFREAPPMIDAAMCLKHEPDCYLVDGHGYAHPRRMGLASHIGLFLDTPTIGCAKNILVGEFDEPGEEVGDHTSIWDGEPVGFAFRSQEEADPVFFSPGHKIEPNYIPEVVEPLLTEKSRLPEPVRLADRTARDERERIELIAKPFLDEEIGVFLVGGTLRDLLTGNQPEDYDLMATEFPESCRKKLADQFDGKWFTLDRERDMHRLPGEEVQVDVTVVGEENVVDDLHRRDFTINSIALDMDRESWVDPVEGRSDADQRILRLSGEDALENDPLRILRAYRLAADHRLTFVDELQQEIGDQVDRLEEISKERITEELLKLADRPVAADWFQKMYEDGVLTGCPYFRCEGVDESRLIEHWMPAIKNHPALEEQEFHGGFGILSCFKMGRFIAQNYLSSWPIHKRVKSLIRGSYKGIESDLPELHVLKSSQLHLFGRLFGRGLWEKWDRDRMLKAVIELDEFIRKREEKTREIVEAHEAEENLGEIKDREFSDYLPELWAETVGSI